MPTITRTSRDEKMTKGETGHAEISITTCTGPVMTTKGDWVKSYQQFRY